MDAASSTKNAKKEKNQRLENYKLNSDLVQKGNKRLQEIVLSMLDSAVNPQQFIKQVHYLNPNGYEDIVEERSITSLCGYPMCGNRFKDEFGNRAYIIRNNRVYDISKRRKFCSDLCFAFSEYVGNQIDSSPLYLRDEEETEIKDVHLPQPRSIKPRFGSIVDVTGGLLDLEDEDLLVTEQMVEQRKIKKAKEKGNENTAFSCVSDFAIDSLIQCSENKENEKTKACDDSKESKSSMKNSKIKKIPIKTKTVKFIDIPDSATNKVLLKENSEIVNSTPDDNKIDKLSEKLDVMQINKQTEFINDEENINNANKSNKLGPLQVDVETPEDCQNPISLEHVHQVEKYLCEWMTFETLRTILGDKYVRGMLEHLGHSWEDYDSVQGLRLGVEAKAKYLTLCRKLDKEEQEELYNDIELPEENMSNSRPSGQLPDYQKLAIDTKQKGCKVVAFLQGKDCYTDEKQEEIIVEKEWPDANKLGTIAEETGTDTKTNDSELKNYNRKKIKAKRAGENKSESEENETRLPHIDSYAQNTWRRQIVMEKLSKTLGELSVSLGLQEGELRPLVTEIIATFDLSPHNIMLKPAQWTLVTLALLQMLSVRYKVVESAMQTSNGQMLIRMILGGYTLDNDYLQRLLAYITQINPILTKYHRNTPQYKRDKSACGECQSEILVNNQISKQDVHSVESHFKKLKVSVEPVETIAEELD